jgi:phosphate transport system permease protein
MTFPADKSLGNPPALVEMDKLKAIIAKSKFYDSAFTVLGIATMALAILVLGTLIAKLFIDGASQLNWAFLTNFPSSKAEKAGVYSAWVGSLIVIVLTALVSVPMGIGAAVYLEEYAKKNWLADLIEVNVTNLAGVPSIIYGLLGLGIFKYVLNLGPSLLTAGLTLALLVLPVVIVATREGIRSIPGTVREAAYALGATKWQVIWDHILPYSTGSTLTGTIVALSRAFGETAPLIVVGAVNFIAFLPENLLSPFTVLPIQMFDWVGRPDPAFQQNAAAAGIVIIVMTLGMNAVAIYLRYRLRRSIKW